MRYLAIPLLMLHMAACDSMGDSPTVFEPEREYAKSINRVAANAFEYALIDSAEAAYPHRDSVLAVVVDYQKSLLPDSEYWYYAGFNGLRFPYAITADAVQFYSRTIDSLAHEKPRKYGSRFEYEATVRFEDAYTFHPADQGGYARPWDEAELFEDVFVVDMWLAWDDYVRVIRKKRIVVFNKDGNMLRVFLDGNARVAVA